MAAYYNEIDPFAAAWLRELIKAGHIAHGVVDERSIVDIRAADLVGFRQCHFFAGVGGWSYALRLAGWSDDRECWTGSCPCQPLSSAGKRKGHADERHLWPAFHRLIAEFRPATCFGEQVDSRDGREWLAAVRADLEGDGYAIGAAGLPACGVGAPHIRQRLWWIAQRVADDKGDGWREGRSLTSWRDEGTEAQGTGIRLADDSRSGRLEHPDSAGLQPGQWDGEGARHGLSIAAASGSSGMADADGRHASAEGIQRSGEQRQQPQDGGTGGLADAGGSGRLGGHASVEGGNWAHDWISGGDGEHGGLADPTRGDQRRHSGEPRSEAGESGGEARPAHGHSAGGASPMGRPSPPNGLWRDADWLHCRDGKWRPVESGTFPLAHGAPARVGRLRGYGNAIVAEAGAVFIQACEGLI